MGKNSWKDFQICAHFDIQCKKSKPFFISFFLWLFELKKGSNQILGFEISELQKP